MGFYECAGIDTDLLGTWSDGSATLPGSTLMADRNRLVRKRALVHGGHNKTAQQLTVRDHQKNMY